MRPLALPLLALAFAIEESLYNVAGKITDVRRAGQEALDAHALGTEGGNVEQQQPPAQPPALPVPFAGETSDEYAGRYPDTFICTVPTGLKHDPWHVIEQDGVFTRGAWIPLDAPFTAPLV